MEKFLIDINPNIELPNYDLVLCKLNEEPIQELHNILDLEIKAYFANIDEISFRIPFYRTDNDGTKVKNEIYDLVDGSMMVLVNDMRYFTLTKPEIKTNEQTGEIYKTILGFSREYELAQKRLVGYEGVSRMLYDPTNQKDENGLEIGFLNYIEKNISWKVGYINIDLLTKYRHLSFSKATYLQAFQEVQQAFGCLFKFDTINKIINVYKVEQLGKNQGLYISDKNFIKSLSQTINHDEIKTRLYLYGKDNISVQSINITGQPYIDNYDFFKNSKYMTQDLIDALNTYENYIQTKEGEFNGYLAQLETLNDSLSTKKIELATLITELKVIESNLDVAISSGQSTSALKQQQTAKIQEINNKQLEIDNLMIQINAIHTNIDNLSIDINLNNHLTEEQARELDPFIREDEYSDSNYTEDNLQELLDEGKKILARVSYPNLQFDVDVEDFLSLVEGQHMWDNFILGDLVTLEHEELSFNYEIRLVGYEHNPDNYSLKLIFSNRDSVDDANIYLSELLESVTTTASTVDFNRYKWDKGEEADFIINQYVNENLNLAKQQIMKAEGQQPMIDERGIWLIKENPDGSTDNAQLRLVNNAIVMTNDNWNSIEWALTADKGINANLVRGKLGQFAQIDANQITVGGGNLPDELTRIQQETQDKINLVNGEISDVDGKINGLENFSNAAFKDGILDMAEKESLLVHIQQLNNEKTDVDAKYTSIYADANLIGVSKSALLTARNSYNTSHSALLTTINNITGDDKITGVEKTQVDNAFIDYRAKLSALSTAFENAIRAIESKKAEVIANDLIVNFNTNVLVPTISDVQTQIDGKIESWNQEDDPSTSWSTSDLKLKHTGDMWYKPSAKELKRYNGSVWLPIEDKQAIDAFALANTKRTIFTTQPITPYVIGDLWKVSNIAGIDFKICIVSRSSGSYSTWDWVNVNNLKAYVDTQRTELNTSIAGLNTTISTAFSDNSITNIEAQSISLARDSVIKEANDIRAIAVSLSVSITSLDSAINNLNTEVNKYVGKTTYPITVTATNRTALTNAFTSLEGAITQLYKSIDEKRISSSNTSLTNYIDNISDDLIGLIDNKVDTWFYAVDPTLSNPPASGWTTNTIKDKHIGDLYFNMTNGYTFRFKKAGTTYSWERIKDKDIIDAMTKANDAQDTADGKRTIFTSQPTPPYSVGDLWRVTDVNGVDFKICTTTMATGSFSASHWVNVDKTKNYIDNQVGELDNAIDSLQVNISDFGKDLKLTATEASTIEMDLERVTYESTDLINIATSLGITAEKDNYIASLNTLTNYLNLYWLNATYPLTITQTQINNVTNHFKYLDDRKMKLINKISETREQNALGYIDNQVEELNVSVDDLGDVVTNAFSDSYITNIEANNLDLARNNVIKEATDVKNIAISLSVPTSAITTAIDNLNTEVNKYAGKSNYPIPITLTDRNSVLSVFTSLEGAITQLYKSIDEKRLANTSSSLTGIINGIQTDLQTQIDGKIDTWFYAVEPTLSNPPANSWTTNAIKDKHIDDLYYDTVKGFAYRFTKVGTVYSWQRIIDSDITKALSDASTAKATADGKMTVYVTQPTTPYHIGDLWRETANATDLKICTTERLAGDYVAGDWSNATNVSGALSGLQGSINDFSSDLKLTLAEANGLKTSLESVTSESLELISTATTLGITTEKTNYSTSLTTLTNYLNTNWLGKTYPLTITVAQRTTVNNYFKDLENKKSILLTKITEVREERANSYTDGEINTTKTEFKVTTDAISSKVTGIETDTSGLKTRMSSAENKITPSAITNTVESNSTQLAKKSDIPNVSGLVTKSEMTQTADDVRYEFKNIKNANGTDASIETGNIKLSKDGIKVTHSGLGGQYSEMRADGFVRKWQYGESSYLSDIWVYKGIYSGAQFSGPTLLRIDLPERFRGRTGKVKVILAPTYIENRGLAQYERYLRELNVVLEVYDVIITSTQAYARVYAYTVQEHPADENSSDVKINYRGLNFDLIAIGE